MPGINPSKCKYFRSKKALKSSVKPYQEWIWPHELGLQVCTLSPKIPSDLLRLTSELQILNLQDCNRRQPTETSILKKKNLSIESKNRHHKNTLRNVQNIFEYSCYGYRKKLGFLKVQWLLICDILWHTFYKTLLIFLPFLLHLPPKISRNNC